MAGSKKIPKKKTSINNTIRGKARSAIKRKRIINVSLSVIFVVLLIFSVSLLYFNSVPNSGGFLKSINDRFFPKPSETAAVVNGEEITMDELDNRYSLLPQEYQQFITKSDVLSQIIDEKILLQESKRLNIDVSDEEINDLINSIIEENQITYDEFEQTLASRGLTIEDVKDLYRNDLRINKLLNMTVVSKVMVNDTQIKDFYLENLDQFTTPETRNVSHILICYNESVRCVSNLTKLEAQIKVWSIYDIVNASNFGKMASEFSDEPNANITQGNLGWLTNESAIDETFLNATFRLEKNEISTPVETVFGYHIIFVPDIRSEELIDLDTVYDQINQTLTSQMIEDEYLSYLSDLRNNSVISYMEID